MAPDLRTLVIARIVQGLGGACSSVLGGVLLRAVFPKHLLGRGISLFGLTVAISTAMGPSVAAGILTIANWRWLFAINVPIAAAALSMAARALPTSSAQHRPFDVLGTVLNGVGIVSLIVGIDELGSKPRLGLLLVALGVAFTAMLVWHQQRHPHPLVPVDLLRIPVFSLSFAASVFAYTAQTTAYVSLPFFFEHGLGYNEVRTGLLITPWPLIIVIVAPLSGYLSDRYSAGALSSIGLFCLAAGLLALSLLPAVPDDWQISWRMVLCGVGFGFFQTPNNRAILTAGPPTRTGAANGMMAQARLLGTTLGAAVVAVGFGLVGSDRAALSLLLIGAGFAAVAGVVSLTRLAA